MDIDTLETLKDWDDQYTEELVAALNERGIVIDEDGIGISSTMMEKWNADCTEFLRSQGFVGQGLRCQGKFYSNHGAVYALFDEGRYDQLSVERHLDLHVKNYV